MCVKARIKYRDNRAGRGWGGGGGGEGGGGKPILAIQAFPVRMIQVSMGGKGSKLSKACTKFKKKDK